MIEARQDGKDTSPEIRCSSDFDQDSEDEEDAKCSEIQDKTSSEGDCGNSRFFTIFLSGVSSKPLLTFLNKITYTLYNYIYHIYTIDTYAQVGTGTVKLPNDEATIEQRIRGEREVNGKTLKQFENFENVKNFEIF